jgi:hypothetical protein
MVPARELRCSRGSFCLMYCTQNINLKEKKTFFLHSFSSCTCGQVGYLLSAYTLDGFFLFCLVLYIYFINVKFSISGFHLVSVCSFQLPSLLFQLFPLLSVVAQLIFFFTFVENVGNMWLPLIHYH